MSEQSAEPGDPRVPRGTAEPPAARCTGVFFPQLVGRCVTEAHAALARTARIQTSPGPMSLHAAGDRLRVLARAKGRRSAPVRQVLFVDAHDTGPAQIAAGLLTHYAGAAVVARSAGVRPGAAVDPFAVEVLAQHGIEPATVTPRLLTEDLVRATDWVITVGPQDPGPMPSGPPARTWLVGGSADEDGGPSLVAALDGRVQGLWAEIRTSPRREEELRVRGVPDEPAADTSGS
ncbi:arsenate-mycothiol transferase ArsC [Kocuria rosea]|uniref:arsenate-mycothiol transferase ArsC n=1 Tax=Kocuria rosea TaxID=1275 RepID=UPI00203BE483|nr:arsenate reductase ArsC [Kocuria rosea]MCM3687390.1 arsenate reductase ArsC [Kocuria rosea]